MTFSGTIDLDKIAKIGFYFNTKRYPESKIATMLKESGGDIIMNASIFLRNGKPACYLKADGVKKCTPTYDAYGLSWSTPPTDLAMTRMKNCTKANYIHDCYLIVNKQKIAKPNYGDDRYYACNRTAIGMKNGKFAYYVTETNLHPEQLRDILYNAGWSDAIMLDGGGSTTINFKEGKGFIGSDPKRYIPFYLVIYLKHTTPVQNTPNSCPYAEPLTLVMKGDRGDSVRWAQWNLVRLGYDIGKYGVDGDFGTGTKNAVIALQKKAYPTDRSQWDGIVGLNTRKLLR